VLESALSHSEAEFFAIIQFRRPRFFER
jgi:hypothetical protein